MKPKRKTALKKKIRARKMTSYLATGLAEGFEQGTPAEQKRAWQFLVDTGLAWRLQGWFGRNASSMLEAGFLKPPKKKTKANTTDYYGQTIFK